jgi:hypothetical protein
MGACFVRYIARHGAGGVRPVPAVDLLFDLAETLVVPGGQDEPRSTRGQFEGQCPADA